MDTVNVTYHREPGAWWADSDSMPGFSALAADFASTRELVREGLANAGLSGRSLVERLEDGAALSSPFAHISSSNAPVRASAPARASRHGAAIREPERAIW